MEHKDTIHLPTWVKLTALVILAASCLGGVFLAWLGISRGQNQLIDPAFSLIQFSSIGFSAALILFYAQRELSLERLILRFDLFFTKTLLDGMKTIRMPAFQKINGVPIDVSVEHEPGQPRAFYKLQYDGYELAIQVDANIKQILVMYHYPISGGEILEELTEKFSATKNGAEKVGWVFNSTLEPWTFDGRIYFTLYFRVQLRRNFLLSPPDMLFWITDISIMSRSALLKGIEGKVLRRNPQIQNATPLSS